ncbi:hypothetical protein [Halorubrum sp. PV6]|uniref:hypothetical protein n=1 Tax=Halorubrum sp. PV6 TaxID=634157 RepID=UPI002AA2B499|nr:hypothetical protein [Halorubrum sp. PV6]
MEYLIVHKLRNDGHDVKQVDDLSEFGKGSSDREPGHFSNSKPRLILTYVDDFVLYLDTSRAVLYINDVTIPSGEIADEIYRVLDQYPQAEIDGVVYVEAWI